MAVAAMTDDGSGGGVRQHPVGAEGALAAAGAMSAWERHQRGARYGERSAR